MFLRPLSNEYIETESLIHNIRLGGAGRKKRCRSYSEIVQSHTTSMAEIHDPSARKRHTHTRIIRHYICIVIV